MAEKQKIFYLHTLEPFKDIKWVDWYTDFPDYYRSDESCAIRSIMYIFGKNWEDTYKEMNEIALNNKTTFNDTDYVLVPIYNKHGYILDRSIKGNVGAFISNNMKGDFSILTKDHIFTVMDGTIYDAFPENEDKYLDELLCSNMIGVFRKRNSRIKGFN